jgi:hypothetical protein
VNKPHADFERERLRREPATKHDLEQLRKIIMSVLSDLQKAVAALQVASANETSAVLAAIADIASLPAQDAALVPLTTVINSVAASTQANADKLNAAVGVPGPAPTVTLSPIPPVTISLAANLGSATVSLSGIGSTAPSPSISVSVVSDDNGAVISTPSVTYTSPNSTGSLSFTPIAVGTANVTVTVSDGTGKVSQSFAVAVVA